MIVVEDIAGFELELAPRLLLIVTSLQPEFREMISMSSPVSTYRAIAKIVVVLLRQLHSLIDTSPVKHLSLLSASIHYRTHSHSIIRSVSIGLQSGGV